MLEVLCRVLIYSLVLLVGLYIWFLWSYRHLLRVANKIPCTAKRWPILGHAHLTMFGWEEMAEAVFKMTWDAVQQGLPTICFWCGPLPLIVLQNATDIEKVMNSSCALDKSDEYSFFKYAGGDGLLLAPASIWKTTRRYIDPLFHPRNLDTFLPTVNRSARELVATLRAQHVGRGQFNVLDPLLNINLKTACHLAFGPDVKFDTDSELFLRLKQVLKKVPELGFKRALQAWLRVDMVFNFFHKKDIDDIDYVWRKFTESPLKETKANNARKRAKAAAKQDYDSEDGFDSNLEEPLNLVELFTKLQEHHPNFTEKDLKHEVVTLYATGTDSLATQTSNTLMLLAQYQDVQDRVYQEILSTLRSDEEVTSEDLRQMPYLDSVYKESLRWASLVPYIARKTNEDLKLSSCTIPAGHAVVISLLGMHCDPKTYPDPDEFIPERFTPENAKGLSRFNFVPFSGGPRNCIGKRYAELFLKLMLIYIIRNFKLVATSDMKAIRKKMRVGLFSQEGFLMRMEERH